MVNKTYNFHYRIKNGYEIHKYTSFAKNYIFYFLLDVFFNNKMIVLSSTWRTYGQEFLRRFWMHRVHMS